MVRGRKGRCRSVTWVPVCVCSIVRSCVWRRTVRRCKCNSRRGLVVSSPRDISSLLSVKLSLFQPCLVFVPPTRRGPTYFRAPGAAIARSPPLPAFDCSSVPFFPFPFCLFASCLLSLFFYIYTPSSRKQDLGGVGPTSLLY